MPKSKISWTDETWNPVTGCTKVSAGCANCYAERMAKRLKAMGQKKYRNGFKLTLHPDTVDDPLRWKRPRMVFVNSMSDLFHEEVPDEFIDTVFAVMALSPHHIFQVLTKRADRMAEYIGGDRKNNPGQHTRPALINFAARDMHLKVPFASDRFLDPGRCKWPPPNVWMGVSVENQDAAGERIPHLLKCPAAVRFLSCEPLLGPVDLAGCMEPLGVGYVERIPTGLEGGSVIDWVIVGGESGPGARPMDLDWARLIRDDCKAAGVPFWYKHAGAKVGKGSDRLDGELIQEFPR